jgi:hypothetical protein
MWIVIRFVTFARRLPPIRAVDIPINYVILFIHNHYNLLNILNMQHKLLLLVNNGLKVLEKYAWLLDSYVLVSIG